MSNKPTIIIDTDAGHDDALALMLLVKSEQFNIQAVTTVAGNSTIDKVTRNAQAVMDLLDVAEIPIYSGCEKPLKRNLVTAVVHGESGLDGIDVSKTKYNLTKDAVAQMKRIVDANPNEVSILTLGPLTNVATFIATFPVSAQNIKEIIIMGGAVNVPGNKNRVAEFNVFVDPEAADIVFKSKMHKILIPLDPCNDTILSIDTFDELKGTSLYVPLTTMMKHFIAGIEMDEGTKGALVYDAIAAYYLINPRSFDLEPMDILVETKGNHTFGMTVAEKRTKAKIEHNIKVATKIDSEVFVSDLIKILKKEN